MENRVSRFVTPLLIGLIAYLLVTQFFGPPKDPAKTGASQVATSLDPTQKTSALALGSAAAFDWSNAAAGTEEKPGFEIEFHTRGGAVKSAKLADYFAERDPAKHTPETRYPVIEHEPGTLSFAIDDFRGTFPIAVDKELRRVENVDWVRDSSIDANPIIYKLELANGLTIRKSFRFFEGMRHFQIGVQLIDRGKTEDGQPTSLPAVWRYRLRGPAVLRNPSDEYFSNPAMVFAMPEREDQGMLLGGPRNANDNFDYPAVASRAAGQNIAWAGQSSRFFTSILWPDDQASKQAIQAVHVQSLPYEKGSLVKVEPFSNVAALLELEQRIHAPTQKPSELTINCYLGPKSRDVMRASPEYSRFEPVCDLDLDSGCPCAPGAETLAKMLLWILKLFQSLVGNWGVAIIMLTICVRGAMLPLMLRQGKAMRSYSAKMSKLKPQMDAIKKKFEKDTQAQQKALMAFQREHKLFPPLMGCLPMFATMPVFIGLFTMLRASFDLRHQPFALWINDLSLPDRAVHLGITNLPLVGNYFEYINILPIIMGVLWGLNMLGQPLPEDPQQRQMQKIMRFMPFMFVFFLYTYAAGLTLYMCVSALWTLFEQRIQRKRYGAQATAGAPMTL